MAKSKKGNNGDHHLVHRYTDRHTCTNSRVTTSNRATKNKPNPGTLIVVYTSAVYHVRSIPGCITTKYIRTAGICLHTPKYIHTYIVERGGRIPRLIDCYPTKSPYYECCYYVRLYDGNIQQNAVCNIPNSYLVQSTAECLQKTSKLHPPSPPAPPYPFPNRLASRKPPPAV